jgi:hypothetical protein
MPTCPKRGVLNAGDRPAALRAAVAALVEAAQPYHPRVMPIAQRRAVPASTPMTRGFSVQPGQIGLGNLPRTAAIHGNGPTDGRPNGSFQHVAVPSGSSGTGSYGGPITHGSLGTGGTSTGGVTPFGAPPGTPGSQVGPASFIGPFVGALTAWAQQVTDSITAITETISGGDGMAILWAVDKLIAPYTEPLRIWSPEWVPMAVIAGRIQDTRKLNTPIMTGCAVEWTQVSGGEYIEVRSIDGMAVNDGKTYLYTFLYFGVG